MIKTIWNFLNSYLWTMRHLIQHQHTIYRSTWVLSSHRQNCPPITRMPSSGCCVMLIWCINDSMQKRGRENESWNETTVNIFYRIKISGALLFVQYLCNKKFIYDKNKKFWRYKKYNIFVQQRYCRLVHPRYSKHLS